MKKKALVIVLQIISAAAVLAVGAFVFNYLMSTKPKAARSDKEDPSTLVEVIEAFPSSERVVVDAQGTVVPAQTVVLQPEVSGRVISQHPALVAGGRIAEGETVVELDKRDYELAVKQQQAAVSKSWLDLKIEQGRQSIAKREWKLVEGGAEVPAANKELALRKPHLAALQVAHAAAVSGLERARLAVERTVLKAPFNGIVKEETVEVGSLVGPTSRLATLIGTDVFWVDVSVPVERLSWILVPGLSTDEPTGSRVRVIQRLIDGRRVVREGRVLRLQGELDPLGRMARLVVEVRDPLAPADGDPTGLPLLLGAYVSVEIEGRELDDVYSLPRTVLREGDRIWVMDGSNKLVIRPVTVVWRSTDHVLVNQGVGPGDRIVSSRIATPVDGMLLRTASSTAEGERAADPSSSIAYEEGR